MKFAAFIIFGVLLLQVCVNTEEVDQSEANNGKLNEQMLNDGPDAVAASPGDAPVPTHLPKGPDGPSTFPPLVHSTNTPQQKISEAAAASVPKETVTPAPGGNPIHADYPPGLA
ncbi:hypothetical protein RN001_000556 [Aquatica leii]|uniref:Secreted protein n=1 Tax=Aquatica leii TaxID=1421715 RepID=A0AAN7Q9Q9_9COLE|nr:hypothetical protein RN001_000556 [Aquatica leii]